LLIENWSNLIFIESENGWNGQWGGPSSNGISIVIAGVCNLSFFELSEKSDSRGSILGGASGIRVVEESEFIILLSESGVCSS